LKVNYPTVEGCRDGVTPRLYNKTRNTKHEICVVTIRPGGNNKTGWQINEQYKQR